MLALCPEPRGGTLLPLTLSRLAFLLTPQGGGENTEVTLGVSHGRAQLASSLEVPGDGDGPSFLSSLAFSPGTAGSARRQARLACDRCGSLSRHRMWPGSEGARLLVGLLGSQSPGDLDNMAITARLQEPSLQAPLPAAWEEAPCFSGSVLQEKLKRCPLACPPLPRTCPRPHSSACALASDGDGCPDPSCCQKPGSLRVGGPGLSCRPGAAGQD